MASGKTWCDFDSLGIALAATLISCVVILGLVLWASFKFQYGLISWYVFPWQCCYACSLISASAILQKTPTWFKWCLCSIMVFKWSLIKTWEVRYSQLDLPCNSTWLLGLYQGRQLPQTRAQELELEVMASRWSTPPTQSQNVNWRNLASVWAINSTKKKDGSSSSGLSHNPWPYSFSSLGASKSSMHQTSNETTPPT